MSQTKEKLESGVPIQWVAEEYGLSARAIEGVNAFQALRDRMDKAMQSEECTFFLLKCELFFVFSDRGTQVPDLLDELFDEDSDDSDSDEEEEVLSNCDSENMMSILSQPPSSPPIVHIHKHISFMVPSYTNIKFQIYFAFY